MYYFVSGFTSKVAGTEIGVTEPVPTFSTCFGEQIEDMFFIFKDVCYITIIIFIYIFSN